MGGQFNRCTHKRYVQITLVIIVFVWIFYVVYSPHKYSKRRELPSIHDTPLEREIVCHYAETEEVVPAAEGLDTSPHSIFFVETSCRGDLDWRQICSVESAARANPDWDVHVLFASPIAEHVLKHGALSELGRLRNIRIARIHLLEFAKGSPVDGLIRGGAFNSSSYPVTHTSDVLRILTLYKYGGVYLDLDVVVAKSFNTLPVNFAARQSESVIATGVIGLAKDGWGRNISETLLRNIANDFRGDAWSYNGPEALTRTLRTLCNIVDVKQTNSSSCHGCITYLLFPAVSPASNSGVTAGIAGFEVLGAARFYPIYWSDYRRYFEPGEIDFEDPYMYHVWNKMSEQMDVHKDSPYAKLTRTYCPGTYKRHKEYFGSDNTKN